VVAQSFLLQDIFAGIMGGDNQGLLCDSVRSHYYLLEKAVEGNACAKILGNPFDDSAVVGLARNVLVAIKQLPEESRNKFDKQWEYALDIITVFKPIPVSHYTASGKANVNLLF
jgi:hypothetical protein